MMTRTILNPKNIRHLKYFSLSILLMSFSCLVAIYDPLEIFIEDQLTMRPGSLLFYVWKQPPIPVILKVYVFNITNAEEFLNGVDKKLKVTEVGPYCYQEFLENKNATFHENNTLSYVPERYSIPRPDLSVGDVNKDIIVTVNLPLLGFSASALKLSTFAALAFSTLAKSTKSKPILNLTVHDYLWGYDDQLIRVANTVLPNFINFDRVGLMDRLFDEGQNSVTIILPKSLENKKEYEAKKSLSNINTKSSTQITTESSNVLANEITDVEYELDDDESLLNRIESLSHLKSEKTTEKSPPIVQDYSIDRWNGSPGLKHWGYSNTNTDKNIPCNTIRGAYDGTLFPRNVSKNQKFRAYRVAFCRTLPIEYSHAGSEYGLDANFFKLTDNAFDDSVDDPNSSCYCSQEKTCMKKGLGNITPCYYHIPAAVSLPHFYNSDPTLLSNVEGLNPIKEKHEPLIIMHPRLGVPVKVRTRIQLTLVIGETKFNSEIKKFDNLSVPVLWIEIAMDLPFFLKVLLNVMFNILPILQKVFICLFMLIGIAYLITLIANFFCHSSKPSDIGMNSQKSIKYTAVFPYIKREMARFEERERELTLKTESV